MISLGGGEGKAHGFLGTLGPSKEGAELTALISALLSFFLTSIRT